MGCACMLVAIGTQDPVVSATESWSNPYSPHYLGAEPSNGQQLHSANYAEPSHSKASESWSSSEKEESCIPGDHCHSKDDSHKSRQQFDHEYGAQQDELRQACSGTANDQR